MVSVDYLVVGSGLTGATIARSLHDAGKQVLVIERRHRVGGNVVDDTHPSGIRFNLYGPHYFRTDSLRIWDWANQFAEFYLYEARLLTYVDGKYEHWPIQADYITKVAGSDWRSQLEPIDVPKNFEEACLQQMPRVIYEKFVKGYTEKQWGVSCTCLDASLAGRFDVRTDGDTRLKQCKYQGLPKDGYSAWLKRMLEGIAVEVNCDFMLNKYHARKKLIFTGPIDEYFGFDLGKLHYRGQQREHYYQERSCWNPCVQVNYPSYDCLHIREIEWKHISKPIEREYYYQESLGCINPQGTLVTQETPYSPDDPDHYEYPFPDDANRRLYLEYRKRVEKIKNLVVCGRLGCYRYLDMDQAIAAALKQAERLIDD